jgi:DNA polymerase elongation subunit (family B)
MVTFLDIETKPMCGDDLQRVMPTFKPASNIKDEAKKQSSIEAKQVSFIEKAALSPLSGTVQSIGVLDDNDDYVLFDTETMCEYDMLEHFWSVMEGYQGTIVGWNILNFDLPFLCQRSWVYGIRPSILNLSVTYNRYTCEVLDLMQYMCLSKDQRSMSLSNALNMLDLDSKCDLDGLLPYEVYKKTPERYYAYLRRDVEALCDIYERLFYGKQCTKT